MAKNFLGVVAVNTQTECEYTGWLQAVALLLFLQSLGRSLLGPHLSTPPVWASGGTFGASRATENYI